MGSIVDCLGGIIDPADAVLLENDDDGDALTQVDEAPEEMVARALRRQL